MVGFSYVAVPLLCEATNLLTDPRMYMYMHMYMYWYIFAFHCTDVESTHLVNTEHQ